MVRIVTRQSSAFDLAVGELVPGREITADNLLALCRAKSPRFGYSTLQCYAHEAIQAGVLIRVSKGIYAVPDAQGGATRSFPVLHHVDPTAEVSARLVHIEENELLLSKQNALLDRKLDHLLVLIRQVASQMGVQ